MKKANLENNKGITLIALIITIIVLLILAGVTLSMVMGDSGIFKKANNAKNATEESNIIEDAKLAVMNEQTEYYSTNTSGKSFKQYLEEKFNGEYKTSDNAKLSYNGGNLISYNKDGKETLLLIDDQNKISISSKIVDNNNTYITNSDGTLIIVSTAENETEITIPSEINGMPVVSIDANFAQNSKDTLTKIIMPDTIKNIGDSAFEGCYNVTEIKFSNTLEKIGNNAFENCGNSIAKLEIPDTVNTIGDFAFDKYGSSNIKELYIGKNVNKIGTGAFSINSLQKIVVSSENNTYKSIDGVLYSKSGNTLIQYPVSKDDITTFEIPNEVKTIGQYAICRNGTLTSVTMSNSVTKIAKGAFSECFNLANVTLSPNVKTIEKNTFEESGITQINLANGNKIEDEAFIKCKLTEVTLPQNINFVGNRAFSKCSKLTKAVINANITTISNAMFENCSKLSNVTISSRINTFEEKAFKNCEALTLNLPETLTTVKKNSVLGPKISNVPNNLKNIENESFGDNISEDLKIKIQAINPDGIIEYTKTGTPDDYVYKPIEYIYDEQ